MTQYTAQGGGPPREARGVGRNRGLKILTAQASSEEQNEAAEVDEAEEVFGVALVADGDAAEALEPREEALHLPAALVSAEGAKVLGETLAIRSIRSDQLDSPLLREPRIERVAVVSGVSDKALWELGEEAVIKGSLDERDFMRRSTFDADGDRKTRAVCNGHDLGPLATLRFSDAAPPFLALTNVPSMNASLKSS